MLRRKLTIVFVVIAVIATAVLLFREIPRRIEQSLTTAKEEEVDLGAVVTRVRDLNRLETAAMRVTHVSTITQSYKLVPNAMGGDELTLFATGDVIAGVDLSLLKTDDVHREPDGTIVVRLPPPQLLVSRLDNRATHVINRRTGVFRRSDIGMEGRARQYAEQNIRNEAIHRGILPMAQQNAEARVAGLLHTLGAPKVRFDAAVSGAAH